MVTRLAWSITEFAEMFGISKGHVYKLAQSGDLHIAKIGGRAVVADEEVQRFSASLKPETAA